MKVLFTESYGEENLQRVIDLDYEVIYRHLSKLKNDKDTNTIDILVGYNPYEKLDISKIDSLKYIQLSSVGFDHVPKDIIKNRNITICNNKGGYSIPMAEYIVMNILNLYKNSFSLYNNQKNKIWKMDSSLLELCGKRIGFIGTGTIAVEAAKRLSVFGVTIYGVNTSGNKYDYFDECFSIKDINKVLQESDVIITTIPSTNENYNFMDEDKFKVMKDNSIFINVSRGSIVDEDALMKYINKFRGVVLDVVKEEPMKLDNPLWNYDNVIITPHNSWISERNKQRTFEMIYENLRRYKNNEKLINLVDINKGY